jgi:hypothetical protein
VMQQESRGAARKNGRPETRNWQAHIGTYSHWAKTPTAGISKEQQCKCTKKKPGAR